MFRRLCAGSILVLASMLAIGCGGGGDATETGGSPAATATEPLTATATPPPTETRAALTVLTADVKAGEVRGGGRVELALGEEVQLRVTADVADEVHVHGYDRSVDIAPGSPATIAFTADIPGVFEVELESRGVQLMELVIR
jgi:hypothetical protein